MVKQALVQTTSLTPSTDGFDTPDNDIGSGATFVTFNATTQGFWFYRDGAPVRRAPWIAVQCRKEAVLWCDKKIIDRVDESESPDLDALNSAIPQKDWEEGFDDEPKPPWQMQYSIYFVNPETGEKIISANSTFGQKAAYADLKDKVQFRRRYRGEHVVPVVELSSRTMKTRFGLKPRPHFEVLEWQHFGPPAAPAIAAPTGPVPKISPAEIVMDEIPDHPCPENATFDDGLPF
jgi:hypothetical protein